MIGMNKKLVLLIGFLSLMFSSSAVYALDMTMTINPSGPFNIYAGSSQNFNVIIQNTGNVIQNGINCNLVETDNGNIVLNQSYSIANGAAQTIPISKTTSSGSSGAININFVATCKNWLGSLATDSRTASTTINYSPNPCVAALADATTAVNSAQTAITNAQSKITEATNLGADVTSAQQSLNNAKNEFSNAQSQLSTAQSTCGGGDTTNGPIQANTAKTTALQSTNDATSALNAAQQSITSLTQAKKDASNKLSSALSAISSAKDMAKKADDIIQNATVLGIDTIQAQTDVKSSRAKIDTAQNYYNEANTAFSQGNYELTKQKADSATSYAKDAETLANQAYSSLSTVISVCGEAAKSVTQANSEITQTDEILTKMVYIERSVEKWGVNLSEAKDITSTGQSNIDSAKDLLAQAKIRFQAGKCTEASNVAIESRDKAAEPTNRLSRIVSSMSLSTQDALEKAYSDAQTKITSAENSVKDAQNTYAATQSEIIAAQNDLAGAKSQLSNASSAINEVKSATDLASFVSKASLAFSALDDASAKSSSAVNHANSAKMGLVTTIAVPAAGVAAAAGGGFLYWRKKQKGHKKHGITKELEESAEEVEKVVKMACENCGKEFSEIEKFCSSCGKELKKIVEEKPMKHRKHKS